MRHRRYRRLTLLAAGILSVATGAARAQSVVVSWIQLGPGSSPASLAAGGYGDQPTSQTPTILARSIVSDGVCPGLSLDGAPASTMKLRFSAASLPPVAEKPGLFVDPSAKEPAHFADGTAKVTTAWAECEAVVPPGHVDALIGGTKLKLPLAHPKRFLVLGDTGCRNARQSCANPMAFPTAYLSGYEANFSPDLIIHVGDWLYRETPGAAPNEPWGDTFDSWNADVFYPMKRLLESAPIVMTRGNHESCGRGGGGWYALLDPHPFDAGKMACPKMPVTQAPAGDMPSYTADFEPSYVVKAGGLDFLVHDSSFGKDNKLDANLARNYDLDLTHVLSTFGPAARIIFVTHRPSFGLAAGWGKTVGQVQNAGNVNEQSVFSGGTSPLSAFTHGVPANIGLFLSGHVHQAQYVNLQDSAYYAPQLVVGMSGTLLDPDITTGKPVAGDIDIPSFQENAATFAIGHFDGTMGSTLARSAGAHDEFGFAVLDAYFGKDGTTEGFNAEIYKLGTTKAGTCKIALSPRGVGCDF